MDARPTVTIRPNQLLPFPTEFWVKLDLGLFGRAPSGTWYQDQGEEMYRTGAEFVARYRSRITEGDAKWILADPEPLPTSYKGYTFTFVAVEEIAGGWDARAVIVPSLGEWGAAWGQGPTKIVAMNTAITHARIIVDSLGK